MKKKALIITALMFSLFISANAQLKVSKEKTKVIIHGTSTVHDWQCQVEEITGQAQIEREDTILKQINAIDASLAVKSIRSIEKDGSYYETGMDKKIYEALKLKDFPEITISLKKIDKVMNSEYKGTATLSIAGVSKDISIDTKLNVLADGTLVVSGQHAMKMTDFEVAPPKAMLGMIKSGDDITIDFHVEYK